MCSRRPIIGCDLERKRRGVVTVPRRRGAGARHAGALVSWLKTSGSPRAIQNSVCLHECKRCREVVCVLG